MICKIVSKDAVRDKATPTLEYVVHTLLILLLPNEKVDAITLINYLEHFPYTYEFTFRSYFIGRMPTSGFIFSVPIAKGLLRLVLVQV
jgi:hypothetical protein